MRGNCSKLVKKIPELSLSQFNKVAILTYLGLGSCLAADLFQLLLIHQVHMLLCALFKPLKPCSYYTV